MDSTATETRILALDPANQCGWAHSDGSWGVWELSSKFDKHPGRRLERFFECLQGIKRDHGVDVIASEQSGFGSKFSVKTGPQWELVGIIKFVAARWESPLFLFSPTTLKAFLAGHGFAKKEDMVRRAREFHDRNITDHNVADAVAALLLTKQQLLKGPSNGGDTGTTNKEQSKIRWPRRRADT